ncbi:D-alanyl-D-alanine carboxypeptidase [Streptomyces sp. NPDC007983]|uniref:D-alanyl-D-alanine carboxypeptidase n=1 Tax=Streptomyces sp. NPDC007983 TaxID=3364800 RepID=UPI0036ED42C8
MAGESPGRSDQQKSSGETARGARDPRLTASREEGAGGGRSAIAVAEDASESAPAEPESERPEVAGDGDTSDVRESEDSESVEAEAESGDTEAESGLPVRPKGEASPSDAADKPGKSDESDESGESGETGKPEGSDSRLREAVAAWVGSGEPDADADAKAEAEGEDKPSDAPVDQRTTSLRTKDVPAEAKGDDDAEEATSGDAPSETPVDRKTAVFRTTDVPSDAKAEAEAEDSDSSRPAKAGSGDAGDEDGEDDASSAEGEAEDADVKGAKGAKGAKDARDVKGAKDAKDAKDAKADDKRASGGRRPAWADDDGDEDEGDAKAASDDGDDKPSGGRSVDQKTAVFRAPKVDDKPIDRPTAAFGVLPEKKKGVDQPTTAIKALPGDDAKGAKKRAESGNERTSKFVPLRSADDPAPAKAKAKAEPKTEAKAEPKAEAKAPAKPETAAPAKPGELPETERTKQQPLPPQTPDGKQPAPLDLLAQLTNKPPKPETPVRTAVRRVKIWTPLVLLLVVLLGIAQAVRPLPDPELKLTADASYAFKGDKLAMPWPGEGQSAAEVQGVGSLGTSGAQKPVPIASVTKVMTAYVVLKEHPLKAGAEGPRIEIDTTAAKESESADESRASVKKGQSFTQHQLLQLLLINSSNNIARLLARWDAGSLDAFTKKMNDAAKSLGMKNTTYTDPSGLKESTKSTAADQLKLAKAAMESDAFREVVATPNTEIPGLDGKIYNNNNLLVKPGVIGIKTGSSTPAGGALMWGAVRTIDGKKQRILGVVLEQRAPTTLDASLQLAQTESYKLISTVQDALTSATVIKKGDVVGQVDDGLGGTTPVVATKDLKAVGWAGLNVDIEIGDGGKTIPHSAKAGTVVGQVTVGSGPGQVKAPVALQNDLSEPSFGAKLTRIT